VYWELGWDFYGTLAALEWAVMKLLPDLIKSTASYLDKSGLVQWLSISTCVLEVLGSNQPPCIIKSKGKAD
jgi:hypothetical protein